MEKEKKKIILAITGASGITYAQELLKELKKQGIETHLIVSKWAKEVMKEEGIELKEMKKLASSFYEDNEMNACISSTSYSTDFDAMVIVPASVKTISGIANAYTDNLITRTADNFLRCKKKLIIAFRETPISTGCIHNLYLLSVQGALIFPLAPAFYHKPKDLNELKKFITGKLLDLIGIENKKFKRWKGR